MALLYFDGADAGDVAIGKWTSISGAASSTTTRYSVGRSITCGNTGIYCQQSYTAAATVFIGFAYAHASTNASDFVILYGDAGATAHLSLRWISAGLLGLYKAGSLISTATATVTDPLSGSGVWHYIEISATIADSGGTCIVKVDGVTVINFTGDTKNAGTATTTDTVRFIRTSTITIFIDDVYILDGTGSAPYNTFLGEVRVYTSSPSGAGASTQWTPSTGANYAAVDELPYSATDYVTGTTSGHRDTYAMGNAPSNIGTIYAVQTCIVAKKSDAGAMSVKIVDRPGSTNYATSGIALGTADATYVEPLRITNPDTSTAWTASDVNALEAGVEVA